LDYIVKRPIKLPIDNEIVELHSGAILINKTGRMWEQLERVGHIMKKSPENFDWVCKKQMSIMRDGKVVIVNKGDIVPEVFNWPNASAHERQGDIEKKAKIVVELIDEMPKIEVVKEEIKEAIKEIVKEEIKLELPKTVKRGRGRPRKGSAWYNK
jgi:hypothetical protein